MKRILLFASLILCLLPFQFSRSAGAVVERADAAWLFVEVETTVHRKGIETDSDNPEERRWYISNVVAQPEDVPTYSLVKQKIMPYFSRNVMDPFEARGFSLDYGDEDVRLNGESSVANYASRAEAEEARGKEIEYRKGQSGNIYSFELVFGSAKGEETSKPKLIYRDKEQPNYERQHSKLRGPETPATKNAPDQVFAQHASKNRRDHASQEIINVIMQFWDGLGRLDSEKLKETMDWPVTIVEASNSRSKQSLVFRTPAEFDEEFKRTPAAALERHKSEFFGTKLMTFKVQMIGSNLASVSYSYRLPSDLIEKDPKKGGILTAVTVLRRDPRPGSKWKIVFTTVPA